MLRINLARTRSLTRPMRVWGRDVVLNQVIASGALPRGLRWRALRLAGVDVGKSSINADVFVGGRNISIGSDVFINYGVFLDGAAPICIGDRVAFGPRVMVLTGTHPIGDSSRRAGPYESSPVSIGNGCWIGAGAIILPGVTIGDGAVVAAGAVVTSNVPPNTLVAGVPARSVRELSG